MSNSERAIISAQWTTLDVRAWEAVFSAVE